VGNQADHRSFGYKAEQLPSQKGLVMKFLKAVHLPPASGKMSSGTVSGQWFHLNIQDVSGAGVV
jgi:hypothetical protein